MKCQTCHAECNLGPADQFCGDCGHPASAHVAGAAAATVAAVPDAPAEWKGSGNVIVQIIQIVVLLAVLVFFGGSFIVVVFQSIKELF